MAPDLTANATELSAAFLQTAITLGLGALFAFLYVQYRKPYFAWFAVAWLLYALRLTAIISFLVTEGRQWLFWHQVMTGWTALVLLWAAIAFSDRARWRWSHLAFVLFPPGWSFVAIYQLEDFLLAAGPAVMFLSGASLWTAWTFWRHYRRVGARAAAYLGAGFLVWGLHHLDYPFLRARGAWTPWGYYLDVLFVLGIGAGVLLLVVEDLQRGLGALSALSGQLQRRGSEREVLDRLLHSTMSLASVRGSAMYDGTEHDGRFIHGVGACAEWVSGSAPAPAMRAVTRVLRTGHPEPAVGEHPFVSALPVRRGPRVTGALVLVGEARDPFAALDARFLIALGQQVGATLDNADLDRRLQDRTAALERLAARMVHQHEAERRRLSRELHDETAQVFSAVRMRLGLVRERAPADERAELDRVMELVDTGMRSLRDLTHDLRPSLLDEMGFLPALQALVREFRDRTGLAIQLELPVTEPSLTDAAELALFRALQEGLANVLRHAHAARVAVRVTVRHGLVNLVVRDDGRGPSPPGGVEAGTAPGHGLSGMHERVAALGGEVVLSPATGGGAELRVSLPRGPDA